MVRTRDRSSIVVVGGSSHPSIPGGKPLLLVVMGPRGRSVLVVGPVDVSGRSSSSVDHGGAVR